jgi:Carboxypeptidase regulatory-like domain
MSCDPENRHMSATKMKKSTVWTRVLPACAAMMAVLGLWGCPNPNSIGVQQYGQVTVLCVQASNNQPVAGALVSIAGSNPVATDASGKAILPQVVIGTHTVQANAPGLDGDNPSVAVVQDTNVNITVHMSPSQ